MTVECFTGKHLRWSGFIGIPLLLVTGLFVPLVSLGVLLYHRHTLDLDSVRLRYGFIYRPYRYDPSFDVVNLCTTDGSCMLTWSLSAVDIDFRQCYLTVLVHLTATNLCCCLCRVNVYILIAYWHDTSMLQFRAS